MQFCLTRVIVTDISSDLKLTESCQTTTNEKLIMFSCKFMQTAKPSVKFENSFFEIRAVKENSHLIARCPFTFGRLITKQRK